MKYISLLLPQSLTCNGAKSNFETKLDPSVSECCVDVDFVPTLFPFLQASQDLSDMGMHHRKLIPEICELICHVEHNCSSDCKVCLKLCLTNPQYYYYSQPPPPPPATPQVPPWYLDENGQEGKGHTISTYLLIALSLLAAVFFVVCCCAICIRFFSRRRVPSNQQTEETHEDFLDEEHGPVVDHPIWYIRTPGLQQSIIDAITICKYKKGEGLVEGTECSVCLTEFLEDENLRLLPKCNHAFHIPCIDTWLRSHTNCPMCRAPIVTNPARIPSMEHDLLDSSLSSSLSSLESTQMEFLENSGENIEGMENSASELRNRDEEQGLLGVEDGTSVSQTESLVADDVVSIRPRRSVSLDSSSVAKFNLALAYVLSLESDSDSNRVLRDISEHFVSERFTGNENLPSTSKGRSSSFRIRYLHSVVPSSMKRSRSYNGKHLLSWYSGRSQTQKKPNASMRSF